jgi:hypothetical protein
MFGNNVLSGLSFDILNKRLQYVHCYVCLTTIQGTLRGIEFGKQTFGYTWIVDMSSLGSMNHAVMQGLHSGFVSAPVFVTSKRQRGKCKTDDDKQ